MTLTAGSRLGPYEILAPLGAGGMGEVWRARDARLGREVAIKILPEAFAADAERLARFEREAQVLASLNHPNIAHIHGLEESPDLTRALVLELVEGETLADRIAQGPVPLEEALQIARQIAEALEAAHERGIVHRDLKPANVKITPQGKVKVLDFGLAKALTGDSSSPDVSHSPTLTAAATRAGVVIGTAAYMSPEQARGKPVNKRADIWAFGAVLYEMLAGRKAFEGETISDTLAAVLTREPDWTALPASTPSPVRRLLKRCLERDRDRRLHDIADARIDIEESLTSPEEVLAPEISLAGTGKRPLRVLPWVLAAVATGFGIWSLRRSADRPARAVHLSVALPEGASLELTSYGQNQLLALSPDGRRVAFRAKSGGGALLFLRDLEKNEAQPLAGTENGADPFFSPDGEWIAFMNGLELKKVSVHGGRPVTLAAAGRSRGGAWGRDWTIVFAPTVNSGLFRVSAAGGDARPVTTLDTKGGERTNRWPEFLPDGETVLFTVGTQDMPGDYEGARIDAVSLASGKRWTVYKGASLARLAPNGELLLARRGELLAAPFDAGRARIRGAPVSVLQRVAGDPRSGVSFFSVGGEGTLAYVAAPRAEPLTEVVWFDRGGKRESVVGLPPGQYTQVSISPDGSKLAYGEGPGGGSRTDVRILDLDTKSILQLTSDGRAGNPLWTPDGRGITYSTPNGDAIVNRRGDGIGAPEVLWRPETRIPISSDTFAPDGSELLFTRYGMPTASDIFLLALKGKREVRPFIVTPVSEAQPAISPDGRWVAYNAEYEGGPQVYVQAYPGLAGRWQISRDTGTTPRWSKDGKELFFLDGDRLFAVPVSLYPTFSYGEARPLFRADLSALSEWGGIYDVAPDGKRFVFILEQQSSASPPRIDVVLDWPSSFDPPGSRL